jgi:hypothetical protein
MWEEGGGEVGTIEAEREGGREGERERGRGNVGEGMWESEREWVKGKRSWEREDGSHRDGAVEMWEREGGTEKAGTIEIACRKREKVRWKGEEQKPSQGGGVWSSLGSPRQGGQVLDKIRILRTPENGLEWAVFRGKEDCVEPPSLTSRVSCVGRPPYSLNFLKRKKNRIEVVFFELVGSARHHMCVHPQRPRAERGPLVEMACLQQKIRWILENNL